MLVTVTAVYTHTNGRASRIGLTAADAAAAAIVVVASRPLSVAVVAISPPANKAVQQTRTGTHALSRPHSTM